MEHTPNADGGKRRVSLVRILLGILVVPVSLVLTAVLLAGLLLTGSSSGSASQAQTANASIMDKFDRYITNRVSDALEGVLSVKKTYWLSDDDLVAPEPDQSCYGEASDPSQLQWLIDAAADLLEGQELYFSTETELAPGTNIQYYLDDSILVITWKELHELSTYTVSEVKITHPSQFRRFLAGGEYGSEMQFVTTEMAASVNAVVASSGDFYRFRQWGVSVYDGKVYRVDGQYADTCYIDENGDLHFTYAGEILDMETAQAFVDENNIRFSLAFGPILVDDGVQCEPDNYSLGEVNEGYARAGLCQMDSLHYLLVTANSSAMYRYVPTIHQFAKALAQTGCRKAYALDGGQTAVIAMNDQLINDVVYGYQRRISDIIYFATAVPDGG